MGIKDNFSQAVKELWKKDGLEETGEKTDKPAARKPEPENEPAEDDQHGKVISIDAFRKKT